MGNDIKDIGAIRNLKIPVVTINPQTLVATWTEVNENLFTPGEGTFLNELLNKAGGNNIAADVQGWGQYNSEQVITKNPQVIFETYSYYQKRRCREHYRS